jgi:hypothetical protein
LRRFHASTIHAVSVSEFSWFDGASSSTRRDLRTAGSNLSIAGTDAVEIV